jgi:hypothetical protein
MRMISPQLDAPQITITSNDYMALTVALTTHPEHELAIGRDYNTVVTAWRPTDLERAQLAAGEDLYISVLTFGTSLQALLPIVGKQKAAAVYHVGVRA